MLPPHIGGGEEEMLSGHATLPLRWRQGQLIRSLIVFAVFAGSAVPLSTLFPAAAGQVTVYCSILEEQCREGASIFEKTTGIKVLMIRRSTGETYAQIKAEAANPKGDVWWCGPA